MPLQTPKHSQQVKDAIRYGVQEGLSAAEIGRRLAAGTLTGHPEPYPMSESTVQYYVRQARKKLARQTVTKLAAGDPARAIDHLARQLISEAEIGVAELRMADQRDPKTAKKWADVLKTLRPLTLPDDQADKPSRRGKTKSEPVPTDPLSQRLLGAQKTGSDTPTNTTPTNPTDTNTTTNTTNNDGGVPAQASDRPVWAAINGGGAG